jgi:biopolymer transport protein ExbD
MVGGLFFHFLSIPLSFHSTSMRNAIREDAITILLTRDGSIYFKNLKVEAPDLAPQIRESIQSGAERKAYLRVDTRARYVDLEPVLDEIRASGIATIALIAETR